MPDRFFFFVNVFEFFFSEVYFQIVYLQSDVILKKFILDKPNLWLYLILVVVEIFVPRKVLKCLNRLSYLKEQ